MIWPVQLVIPLLFGIVVLFFSTGRFSSRDLRHTESLRPLPSLESCVQPSPPAPYVQTTEPENDIISHVQTMQNRNFRVSVVDVPWGKPVMMAFPDWIDTPSHPGVTWYQQAWYNHTFNGDYINSHLAQVLKTCNSNSAMFQFGSHLAIYPVLAAVQGCVAVAVEGYKSHLAYIRTSALLNGPAVASRFNLVHRAVASESGKVVRFATSGVASEAEQKFIEVSTTTIDEVVFSMQERFQFKQVAFMIIDVEGSDLDAVRGAQKTITSGLVKIFEVEVWYKHEGHVRSANEAVDLGLFFQAGYVGHWNPGMSARSLTELWVKMEEFCREREGSFSCGNDIVFWKE